LIKWLEQCGRAEDVMETDLNLIQFSTIFSDIHLNRFYCDLPDNISKIVKRKSEDEVTNEKNKKKLKKQAQSNALELINNNKQEADWKVRINERFDTVFKEKKRRTNVVMWMQTLFKISWQRILFQRLYLHKIT
jgi:hypothetical protein